MWCKSCRWKCFLWKLWYTGNYAIPAAYAAVIPATYAIPTANATVISAANPVVLWTAISATVLPAISTGKLSTAVIYGMV